MDPLRRHPGFYLLLAMLVAAGSVAAAGQQGAMRGATSTLQAAMSNASSDSSGGAFATPLNVVALANTLGWRDAPSPSGAAELGELPLGGPSPSEWAASEQGTGEAARRSARSATLGAAFGDGPDRPTPELCRLCVYRL